MKAVLKGDRAKTKMLRIAGDYWNLRDSVGTSLAQVNMRNAPSGQGR